MNLQTLLRKDFINSETGKNEFYGFSSWFCKANSLKLKGERLIPKVKFLVKLGLVPSDGDVDVNFKVKDKFKLDVYDQIEIKFISNNEGVKNIKMIAVPWYGRESERSSFEIYQDDELIYAVNRDNWVQVKNTLRSDILLIKERI